MSDERISGSLGERLSNIISGSTETGWRVIHAGKEIGPFTDAELTDKVVGGEIQPDDLVKQAGGLWTKACEVAVLKREFTLRDSQQKTLDDLGRFKGVWVSKRALAFCAVIVALLVIASVAWYLNVRNPHGQLAKGPDPKHDGEPRDKDPTIDEKVRWFKDNLRHVLRFEDFLERCNKAPFRVGLPDKHDYWVSLHEVNREFNPIVPISADRCMGVDRYYPFETPNGPAYRVNVLWAVAADQAVDQFGARSSIVWAWYFRSPK